MQKWKVRDFGKPLGDFHRNVGEMQEKLQRFHEVSPWFQAKKTGKNTFLCEGCESKKHKIPDMHARAYARAGQSDGHNIGQNLCRTSWVSWDSHKYQNED